MTVVALKELKKEVKKYIDDADEETVKAMHAMFEGEGDDDLWNSLSEGERESINRGVKNIEEGRTFTHEEVMKKYSKWLTK